MGDLPGRQMGYRRAYLLIGGAQQDVGERGVGLQDLSRRVCAEIGGEDDGVYCRFVEWHQWREHADVLVQWADTDCRIDLAGYSYGGDAAIRVCRYLHQMGREVKTLLLADAVRRFGWLLPASLWRWWTLRVPPNVSRVEWWRQRNDWRIWGHTVARDLDLRMGITGHEVTIPRLTHAQMDEHEGFGRAVMGVARA